MNQTQREFLIKQVNNAYKREVDKIKETKPKKPSLNNYLVAAVLSGDFRLKDAGMLRENIRRKVLRLGARNALVECESFSDKENETVSLRAVDLFELPDDYQERLEAYEEAQVEYERRLDEAEKIRDTLIIKIQIGSNQVLDKLIDEADNLADISLMNARLMLKGAESAGNANVKQLKG